MAVNPVPVMVMMVVWIVCTSGGLHRERHHEAEGAYAHIAMILFIPIGSDTPKLASAFFEL